MGGARGGGYRLAATLDILPSLSDFFIFLHLYRWGKIKAKYYIFQHRAAFCRPLFVLVDKNTKCLYFYHVYGMMCANIMFNNVPYLCRFRGRHNTPPSFAFSEGEQMIKKLIGILVVLAVSLTVFTACSRYDGITPSGADGGRRPIGGDEPGIIGISMPTSLSPRWLNDGDNLVEQLHALGFQTILRYGDDVVADQVAQINEMIDQGADILVIAAIDGAALGGVLMRAAGEGITVIAYDRLLMDTFNVNYYTTFDNFAVGVMQANSLLMGLGINHGATGPFYFELFGGSMDDNNAFIVYDGAMSVLQPLIENGTLIIRSGQKGMDAVSSLGWSGERARSRMSELLTRYYADTRVDAVLSPYDGISLGIIEALRDFGYGTTYLPWPVISGQDAIVYSVQSIIDGEQFATIFKDTRELAASTVRMIQAIVSGETVPVNDTETYYNNFKIVPSYLLGIEHVDINNWYAVLVESGYYPADYFTLP